MKALYLSLLLQVIGLEKALGTTVDKILFIPSYGPGYWSDSTRKGLDEALQDTNIKVETYKFKYYPSRGEFSRFVEQMRKDLESHLLSMRPKAIVVGDDEAANFVLKEIKWHGPLFFTGLNQSKDNLKSMVLQRKNITGIFENYPLNESVELLKDLSKKTNLTIDILTSKTKSSEFIVQRVHFFFKSRDDIRLGKTYMISEWGGWEKAVASSNSNADALWILSPWSVKSSLNKIMDKAAMGNWLSDNVEIPSLSFVDLNFLQGAMASISVNPLTLGQEVGALVYQHLVQGVPVSEIGARTVNRGNIMINLKATDRIGIEVPIEILEYATVVE